MMIGICDSARTLRHRLRPSSPGSITSRISRSTRWSVKARAISRPSFAVVTWQALVRRYFAISVRVSRSSSTTRMFGDARAMPTFVSDSQQPANDFCFKMFLLRASQHQATCRRGNQKTSLRSLTLPSRRLARTFGAIMTSISTTSSSAYLTPLQKLQNELQTEVSSGAVNSSDQAALSSALTDINSSLQSGGSSGQSGGTQSAPGDLKSKIDNLIAGEVSSGKLTSDQATKLQDVFKATFANGAGGAGGAGGAHGHHGGHGGPPPADISSSTDSTSSSSGTTSTADIVQQFLQSLQNSLSASSSTSYNAAGSTGSANNSSSSFSALLINYPTSADAKAHPWTGHPPAAEDGCKGSVLAGSGLKPFPLRWNRSGA